MNFTFDTVFKNKHGKITVWQRPSTLLYGWGACKLLSFFIASKTIKYGFADLSTALLFAWAYLEITDGANYFRRFLGLLVMALTVLNFFR